MSRHTVGGTSKVAAAVKQKKQKVRPETSNSTASKNRVTSKKFNYPRVPQIYECSFMCINKDYSKEKQQYLFDNVDDKNSLLVETSQKSESLYNLQKVLKEYEDLSSMVRDIELNYAENVKIMIADTFGKPFCNSFLDFIHLCDKVDPWNRKSIVEIAAWLNERWERYPSFNVSLSIITLYLESPNLIAEEKLLFVAVIVEHLLYIRKHYQRLYHYVNTSEESYIQLFSMLFQLIEHLGQNKVQYIKLLQDEILLTFEKTFKIKWAYKCMKNHGDQSRPIHQSLRTLDFGEKERYNLELTSEYISLAINGYENIFNKFQDAVDKAYSNKRITSCVYNF
uniref:Uncharacterized protein n=1 Tax=Rhabditophanes sp. KR3021 TaxID=114890 RepID=A0AC35TVE5_9BILA